MRFLRLELRAFGPFDGPPPIDLGGGSRGLHLIVGPNEAGKSSALRAIRALLFGFPSRTGDDHRHAYKDLRVAGSLRDERGAVLEFVRRKGDVRTIRTPDDVGVVPEETLAEFLGGLDRARFDELFAMDHAELVAGGRGIVEGKGDLGPILFAAGSGIAGIDEVRQALEAEMDELFKPAGKNPAINAAIAELKLASQASEAAMLATSEWVKFDTDLAGYRARKEAVDAEIRGAVAEKRRLERLGDARPVVARVDGVLARLARLGDSPVLSDGFADRRRDAITARQVSLKDGLLAGVALEAVDRDLDGLGPRDPVLDEAPAIGQVRDDLGLYRKARESRPVDRGRLDRLEADARALLGELRPGASLDDDRSHRIPPAWKERILGLARELAGIEAGRDSARSRVAALLEASPGVDLVAATADARRLAEALGLAADRAQAEGDLDAQVDSARAELSRLDRQAAVDLRGLPLWSGTLEELEALASPSTATLDRFDAESRAADRALARVEADLATLQVEKADLDREIDREAVDGPAPTEESLALRRSRRDDEWRAIRRSWLDRQPVEHPARVADDFELALRRADDLADRLRLEADDLAGRSQRRGRRRELLDRINALGEARDLASRARASVQSSWIDTWRPLGIESPLPPGEMRDWVAIRRADLVRQAKGVRDRRLDLDRKAAKSEAIRAELGRHLARLGEPPLEPSESLGALVARARAAVDRVDVGLRLDAARDTLAGLEAARSAWDARWAAAVGPLGLLADASPSQAQAVVDRFDELSGLVRGVAELRQKVEEHDRCEARFGAAVGGLSGRLEGGPASADPRIAEVPGLATAPPAPTPPREGGGPSASGIRDAGGRLPTPSPLDGEGRGGGGYGSGGASPGGSTVEGLHAPSVEATARALSARFDRAQVVEARREEALKRRRDELARIEEARLAVDRADSALGSLVVEAGCGSPEGLVEADRASDERKGLGKELRDLEGQLAILAGSTPLAELRDQLGGADPGTLEARVAELADRLAPWERERDQLGEEVGRCRQRLDAMDGGPAAADARQAIEERLARLAVDVERYAGLRLASAVLREAVERHRKEHQGPVLDRAGALFAALTAGSFAGLRADFDDKGQPVLFGVRGDGTTLLKVEGMSEGTADQLYLALRLASLRAYLDDHEPMPLVVDDILVNFDNARALAALEALAELSGRTQILFFTHHDHLVDLARSALGEDVLFVHDLACLPTLVDGHANGSLVDAARPKRKRKAFPAAGEGRAATGSSGDPA